MTLPPEVLDKILEHVPVTEGRPTLIACSLVATWWTGPSQRRLFFSVSISGRNYQRWMNGVVLPESKSHLLEHVRSLWHCRGPDLKIAYRMRDLPHDSGEYFSALRNLRDLTLFNTRVERISEEGFRTCFSAFRETLTSLSLDTFPTTFSAFVTLVGYFPNIRTLQLRQFTLEPGGGQVPRLPQPLRGKAHIAHIGASVADFALFFHRFAELDLEYEELVIDSSCVMRKRFLVGALQISAGTVKYLRLVVGPHRE